MNYFRESGMRQTGDYRHSGQFWETKLTAEKGQHAQG